ISFFSALSLSWIVARLLPGCSWAAPSDAPASSPTTTSAATPAPLHPLRVVVIASPSSPRRPPAIEISARTSLVSLSRPLPSAPRMGRRRRRRAHRPCACPARRDRLLLELDLHARRRERQLHALRRCGQGHLDAVLVLQRGCARATPH